jgi:glutathione peroxidase
MNIYDFVVTSNRGEKVELSEYKGKVLLIMNTATQCGFTSQYDGLQDLYEKYAGQDFVILDFPCDQFENQAPGTDEEIASFCDSRFGITFPVFTKTLVNGEHANPLFRYLKDKKTFQGFDEDHPLTKILESKMARLDPDFKNNSNIKWNFTKFLIDKEGTIVERFEPTTDLSIVEEKIKTLL